MSIVSHLSHVNVWLRTLHGLIWHDLWFRINHWEWCWSGLYSPLVESHVIQVFIHSLRFTSGVILANLLIASGGQSLFSIFYYRWDAGFEQGPSLRFLMRQLSVTVQKYQCKKWIIAPVAFSKYTPAGGYISLLIILIGNTREWKLPRLMQVGQTPPAVQSRAELTLWCTSPISLYIIFLSLKFSRWRGMHVWICKNCSWNFPPLFLIRCI